MMHSTMRSVFLATLLAVVSAKERALRGSSPSVWRPLGGMPHNVADDEGYQIKHLDWVTLGQCEAACDSTSECKSFAFCSGACYLKSKDVQSDASYHQNHYCTTYYQSYHHEAHGEECYDLFSDMKFNNLVQTFPGNPDSHAKGFTTCRLCTDGKVSCSALVYGGKTQLIASHMHLASDDDGVNGNGLPVFSFCGSNDAGLIDLDPKYPEECAEYKNGNSNNPDMHGVFLHTPPNNGMTVEERVRDVARNSKHYYFNFHSIASWTHWQNEDEGPMGMCRGVMELS